MDNLKLTFPSPHPGTHLLVETRPEEFSHWLENLPSGNMARYVTEVANAIMNINRTELPIVQRMNLIQFVDVAYEQVHDYYRPLLKSGPYKGKHAPYEELSEVYRLTQEMAFAYKIAVYENISKKKFFGKNKSLANAINMALHYLGLVLLEHYELYAPIPMHTWREVHQLYFCAEQRELSEISLPQPSLKNCFDVVETNYIRICLIALSNPYHLKRGDHWEVFSYLSHWTTQAIISEDPDDFSDKNCFLIDLNGDDKPTCIKRLEDRNNSKLRFLLTGQLTVKLCHHIDDAQSFNKSPEKCFSKNIVARKAIELLDDLLASWEMKQERKAPRYPKINKMEVIWGLTNIHKILNSTDPLQANDSVSQSKANIDKHSKLIEQHWNTVNSSDGGICISQIKEKIKEIDVGDLVAIRKSVSDNRVTNWTLGIIRWITGNKRNGTQIGIQYIKGDIQGVQLQARKGNKIETRFQSALLVSGVTINGLNTPTLLTSTGLYIEARPMMLRIGEEEQFIHARMKISSSGSVDRFFYQPDTQQAPLKVNAHEIEESKQKKSEHDEIINLSAMPLAHVEDFNEETEKAAEHVVTLDDMIVSKNK